VTYRRPVCGNTCALIPRWTMFAHNPIPTRTLLRPEATHEYKLLYCLAFLLLIGACDQVDYKHAVRYAELVSERATNNPKVRTTTYFDKYLELLCVQIFVRMVQNGTHFGPRGQQETVFESAVERAFLESSVESTLD
jgi:hypothetical protein